jgi:hypothetical protein
MTRFNVSRLLRTTMAWTCWRWTHFIQEDELLKASKQCNNNYGNKNEDEYML